MPRSELMTVLAPSQSGDLGRHWKHFDKYPVFTWFKKPEIRAVVVRARATRSGSLFRLGEMAITRCSVEIDDGILGHATLARRNKRNFLYILLAISKLGILEPARRRLARADWGVLHQTWPQAIADLDCAEQVAPGRSRPVRSARM
ncbi:phosphonate C-P lyase system protein PhnG [Bradyrhizobium sp. SSUT77]|nr:phosphonate C-P lyase system protein PhnG [Bradyrhizobium sp. SSUT77]MDH2347752.1 phosphonate C-P lyase system protein PhnG [Bradyrhizobium sp. SSUT77]